MINRLYYGDNLDVLREHIAGESIDLVYLDRQAGFKKAAREDGGGKQGSLL